MVGSSPNSLDIRSRRANCQWIYRTIQWFTILPILSLPQALLLAPSNLSKQLTNGTSLCCILSPAASHYLG